jgi:myosin protein heavy chain
MTYVDKLNSQHLGKHPNYQKAKPPKGKQTVAHFAIVHYAGTVRYNAESWLDKNKDPLNDSAVAVLKVGCSATEHCLQSAIDNNLLLAIWDEYKTDIDREEDAARGRPPISTRSLLFVRQNDWEEEG